MYHRILSAGMAVTVYGFILMGPLVAPAKAALVTFQFTGEISSVTPTLGTARGISTGQPFSGSYTFETTTPDLDGSSNRGRYQGITTFNVNMAGQAIVLPQTPIQQNNGIFIFDNEGAFRDRYSLNADATGIEASGWRFQQMRLDMLDPSQNAFNNDSLPSTPPSLSSFAQRSASFTFVNRDASGNLLGFGSVESQVTSLTAVPIPATLLLFGTGLTALTGLRRASCLRFGRPHA